MSLWLVPRQRFLAGKLEWVYIPCLYKRDIQFHFESSLVTVQVTWFLDFKGTSFITIQLWWHLETVSMANSFITWFWKFQYLLKGFLGRIKYYIDILTFWAETSFIFLNINHLGHFLYSKYNNSQFLFLTFKFFYILLIRAFTWGSRVMLRCSISL